jgi:hypothetical protein
MALKNSKIGPRCDLITLALMPLMRLSLFLAETVEADDLGAA